MVSQKKKIKDMVSPQKKKKKKKNRDMGLKKH